MPKRGPDLSPTLRARICELHSLGWGARRIHKQHPEVPISTIAYTFKKERERTDCKSLPRSGRPRLLTPDQRAQVIQATEDNPHIKTADLLATVDNRIKKRSLQYLLREAGKQTANAPA